MPWSWRAAVNGGVLAAAALTLAGGARGEDTGRGRALYEARCDGCHGTSVHNRAARKARDFGGLRREVARWDRELGHAWTDADIDDVAAFLNERYYRFPCPTDVCKQQGRAVVPPHGG